MCCTDKRGDEDRGGGFGCVWVSPGYVWVCHVTTDDRFSCSVVTYYVHFVHVCIPGLC